MRTMPDDNESRVIAAFSKNIIEADEVKKTNNLIIISTGISTKDEDIFSMNDQ